MLKVAYLIYHYVTVFEKIILSNKIYSSWRTVLWQLVIIALSAIVYWPFIKKYDQVLLQQQQSEE